MAVRYMQDAFTKSSHHWENSIIYTTQNYFHAKQSQNIIRNLHYKIIFNAATQRRYMSEISLHISSDAQFKKKVFHQLSEMEPHNDHLYVLIDGHVHSPLKRYPCRTNILPDEDGEITPLVFETD